MEYPTSQILDLTSKKMLSCYAFGIGYNSTNPRRPQTNGAAESSNQNMGKIPRKMKDTYLDWPEKWLLALCRYRTDIRT